MLSWGRLQSRHPPWEVRANRCASAVSMEMCQPGNRDEQPRLALEAFVFTESFLECKHGKQIFQLSRGTGASLLAIGALADQDTPKQGICVGALDELSGDRRHRFWLNNLPLHPRSFHLLLLKHTDASSSCGRKSPQVCPERKRVKNNPSVSRMHDKKHV